MYCNKCQRDKQNLCEYPCLDFQGATDVFNDVDIPPVGDDAIGVSYGIGDIEKSCDDNCLSEFLNYSVEDQKFFEILTKKRTLETIIDDTALYDYMVDLNKEYCDKNGLCEECRSELVEVRDQYEYWGSKVSGEKVWICPRCGY